MRLVDFDFELPPELIAQTPAEPRDSARLMVLQDGMPIAHRRFDELTAYLASGDTLVLNDTKVFPAKLCGRKTTGGKVEVLLLDALEGRWECLVKGKVRVGTVLDFEGLQAQVLRKNVNGHCLLGFDRALTPELLSLLGETPLPPYIKRTASLARYNTVYARARGSVAAPTAGLHFTKRLLSELRRYGVNVAYITLHVGPATFMPVRTPNIETHEMSGERYVIAPECAKTINETEGRLIGVGTSVVRTLEHAWLDGRLVPSEDVTELFIYPGYAFKSRIAGLLTNFHLPQSTNLMLVCAFLSRERVLESYRVAIEKRYRLYSFGDAMLILK